MAVPTLDLKAEAERLTTVAVENQAYAVETDELWKATACRPWSWQWWRIRRVVKARVKESQGRHRALAALLDANADRLRTTKGRSSA